MEVALKDCRTCLALVEARCKNLTCEKREAVHERDACSKRVEELLRERDAVIGSLERALGEVRERETAEKAASNDAHRLRSVACAPALCETNKTSQLARTSCDVTTYNNVTTCKDN